MGIFISTHKDQVRSFLEAEADNVKRADEDLTGFAAQAAAALSIGIDKVSWIASRKSLLADIETAESTSALQDLIKRAQEAGHKTELFEKFARLANTENRAHQL